MKTIRTIFIVVSLVMVSNCASWCQADNTTAPPGSINAFKPLVGLEKVAKFAGRNAKLISVRANLVGAAGTMDLSSELNPHAVYEFRAEPSADDLRELPPRPSGLPHNHVSVRVSVREPGWRHVTTGNSEYDEYNAGMERQVSAWNERDQQVFLQPKCTTEDIWKVAINRGAPPGGLANIRYEDDGYRLSIPDIRFRIELDHYCKLR